MSKNALPVYVPLAPQATAFTATGTTGAALHAAGRGKFTVVFVANQNCHIRFGTSAAMTVAAVTDWYLPLGQERVRTFSDDSNFFSVIRDTADGTLSWYVAGSLT